MPHDGEVRTVCPYCGVGCGLLLRVEGGRVVGLRGEPGHPTSNGALCPKGATAHEFVHHPDRLTRPLVRREKGGPLVPTTWEEALDRTARELVRIRDERGPDALGLIASARGTVEEAYLAQKLARAVLRTNNLDNCYRICHSPTVIGLTQSLGTGGMTNPAPDLALARTILLVGGNPSRSHPIIWSEWMRKGVKAGAKLVVVDPRRTDAARLADLHLQVVPGTEVALLNAMARAIVDGRWVDEAFVAERTEGFGALRALLDGYAPEKVAPLVGVGADEISEAARLYATGKPSSIVYGLGLTEHVTGVDNVRALANLALLTGNLGIPGTGVNALRGQNNVQGATDMCRPETLPGYQSWGDAAAVARFEAAWGAPLPVPEAQDWLYCSRMWEAALAGEIKGMLVIGSDPALTEGHSAKVARALASLEFLAVAEVFPTKTTALADVVFPSASYAEKEGTFVNTERRVQRVRKAIEPVGESRPDWRLLLELARRMERPLGVASPEEAFEELRRLVPIYGGITYSRLERSGGLAWPCPDESHPGTPVLHVEGFTIGRARLAAVDWRPAAETPDDEYPMLLTTGRGFLQYNSGTMTRRTRMEKGEPECWVEVARADADRLGLAEGAPARVRTRRGEVVARTRITEIRAGVIWMPFHYNEAPANALTNDAIDPESGVTELKVCAARLERA